MVEIMETLSIFIHEKEFYNCISGDMKRIGVNIGLTLLRTSKNEFEDMTKDPDNFVHLGLDTCDKQKSMIVKTQAAKIIESICDNIDGAVSFITLFTCQAINMSLKQQVDSSSPDYNSF